MIPLLAILSAVFSLAYGSWLTHHPANHSKTAVKAIPVACLWAIAVLADAPLFVSLALMCGVIGDIALSRDGSRNFLIGLGAFLVGHLCYISLFIGAGEVATWSDPLRLLVSALIAVIGAGVFWHLRSGFGHLTLPVLAYVAVSIGLGWAAMGLLPSWPLGLALIGALLFLASDV